jgi:CDP-glycerol glycerophosphotransferase (TagB/SpsB family)
MKNTPGAIFLNEIDVTKYLLISDVFIGDYNSMIGEFCALDKPIITFKTPESSRSIPAVRELISRISIQIDDFDEVKQAIERSLTNPNEFTEARAKANEIIHHKLDGNAGKRAAEIIKNLCRLDIN